MHRFPHYQCPPTVRHCYNYGHHCVKMGIVTMPPDRAISFFKLPSDFLPSQITALSAVLTIRCLWACAVIWLLLTFPTISTSVAASSASLGYGNCWLLPRPQSPQPTIIGAWDRSPLSRFLFSAQLTWKHPCSPSLCCRSILYIIFMVSLMRKGA